MGEKQKLLSDLSKDFLGGGEITCARLLSMSVMGMVAPARAAVQGVELGRAQGNARPAKEKGRTSCKKPVP